MLSHKRALVAATLDTKIDEALYVCHLLEAAGLPVHLVDLSTQEPPSNSIVSRLSSSTLQLTSADQIAVHHPRGMSDVFCGDRGAAVAAMTEAFEGFIKAQDDVGGLLGIGGSGGTAMVTRAMRALPIGIPKVMVSTMASGDVAAYVGTCDITMMYSVTDVAGLNRISRRVLGNAAHALAGMMLHGLPQENHERPVFGFTMFGVTTPCVDRARRALEEAGIEVVVFHVHPPNSVSLAPPLGPNVICRPELEFAPTEGLRWVWFRALQIRDMRVSRGNRGLEQVQEPLRRFTRPLKFNLQSSLCAQRGPPTG